MTVVRDASMWDKLGLLVMAVQIAWVIIKYRPDVVVSTGAAPGFFALVFGRLIGAKTIWIDSVANAEELSLAGRKVRRWANHWLTQWPDLAQDDGPSYIGSVI
ncbi:Oligosaccharide biosynthesis protein Alg14 like protein [compost metagenome]